MSTTLVYEPNAKQTESTVLTRAATTIPATSSEESKPVTRASIFSAQSVQDWNNSTTYQLAEFQRFTAAILVKRFSSHDQDILCNVASDAFMKVARYMDPEKFGGQGLQGFAASVIRSVAIDHHRRRGKSEVVATNLENTNADYGSYMERAAISQEPDPAEFVFGSELRDHTQYAMNDLDEPLQKTAELLVAGESIVAIEDATGETRSVVRRRISKVLSNFRARLSAFNPENKDLNGSNH